MKILGINIKNLASLEGETTIDFTQEPLCSAGIFAITGVTGAGKSTILDALCLALYAQTPRFEKASEKGIAVPDIEGNTISQNDPRGILRKGTSDGFAEVMFEGIDSKKYLSKWSVRRARNKIDGALQDHTVELIDLETGILYPDKKKETLKEIERLAGLNFEQFTRSVLLAQGDFTAFLKATKDEKASLLEKLTGTSIYSQISELVYKKYKDSEKEVQDLELKKDTISILEPEQIEMLETEQSQLKETVAKSETEKKSLSEELQWCRQFKELEDAVNKAHFNQRTANEDYQNADERFKKLTLIEKAQGAAVLSNELETGKNSLSEKEEDSGKNLQHIKELNDDTTTQKDKKKKTDTALENAKSERKASQPLLAAAATLDAVLKEKAHQLSEAEKQWSEAAKIAADFDSKFNEEQKKEDELAKLITELNDWKESNYARQPIAENSRAILTSLNEAAKIRDDIQEYKLEKEIELKQIEELSNNKTTLSNDVQQKEAILKKLIAGWKEKSVKIEGIDIEKTQKEIEINQSSLEDTLRAKNHWDIQSREAIVLETLGTKLKDTKDSILETKESLIQLEGKLSNSKAVKESKSRLLDKVRLEQSENVEKLRTSLKEGEPCSVCGSVHHPYAARHFENSTITIIEQEFKKTEEEYERSLKKFTSAKENHDNLVNSLSEIETDLDAKRSAVKKMEERWKTFEIFPLLEGLKENNISVFIGDKEEQTRDSLRGLKRKSELYRQNNKETADLKTKSENLSQDINVKQNELKDIDRDIKSKKENIGRLEKLIEKEVAKTAHIQQELNPNFSNDNWFENWKAEPEEFRNRIHSFAEKWKTNETELQDTLKKSEIATARIQELKKQLENFDQEAVKRKIIYEKIKGEQEEKARERNNIFNGRPVKEVEDLLVEKVEFAEKETNLCLKELEELQRKLTIAETEQKENEKGIQRLRINIQSKKIAIDQWLLSNLPETGFEDLHELLTYSSEWRKGEKEELKQIEEAKKHANIVLAEREESLKTHQSKRKTNREEQELDTLLKGITEQIQETSGRSNEITFIIKENVKAFKKAESLIKEIDKKRQINENWARLNEIIGSADGKKFRQIAQEYTLDILLDFANIELRALAKRFSMRRIDGTLGLHVIDHDMGDEIRTVFSLSGGESFLLSLALALGLSSLSSAQMKVESLFIDEGFGALDPQTLNIAMDALERLHNQGRKVGVISHVQEMTERIPVRINVQKLSAGRSKVEISGF